MDSRWIWGAALAALSLGAACAPAGGDAVAERIAAAEAGAALATHCAAELSQLADADPVGAAKLLAVEPFRLAPRGGAARSAGAVREVIAERLEAARANAAAARSLAATEAEAGAAGALARDRAERSLAASRRLCAAADALHDERFASGR